MKFNVSSQQLYQSAAALSKIIVSKNTIKVLDNLYFRLEGNYLTLYAGDPENEVTARIEVLEAEGSGHFCLNAAMMVNFLKDLPDQGFSVTVNNDTLETEFKYESGEYRTIAINGDEYPQRNDEEDEADSVSFLIPGKNLVKAMNCTTFAVATDEYRLAMTGVYFDVKPESITFVATDTRKLVKFTDATVSPACETTCILPIKPAGMLKNLFDNDLDVKVTISQKRARFESELGSLNCSLINMRYPDYNRVVPKNNPHHLIVSRQALLPVVKRISNFTNDELLKLKITSDKIYLKSRDESSYGSAKEEVPCSFEGAELNIGFGNKYLIQILSVIDTDDVLVELGDNSRPGIFRPDTDPEGTELLMLLMPMSISEF